eukprot:gene8169-10130_t
MGSLIYCNRLQPHIGAPALMSSFSFSSRLHTEYANSTLEAISQRLKKMTLSAFGL